MTVTTDSLALKVHVADGMVWSIDKEDDAKRLGSVSDFLGSPTLAAADRVHMAGTRENAPLITALFERKITPSIHQEPAQLLSDGRSNALLTIDIPGRTKSTPTFAARNGTITSSRQDTQIKGRWLVAIIP